MLPPNWAGNTQAAQQVVQGVHHWLMFNLSAYSPIRVHCWTKLYGPHHIKRSAYQTAIKLFCRIRQYNTAP